MKRAGRGGFAVAVLVLTLFAFCCCAGTAMSRTDLSAAEIEGYYQAKEKGLVEEVRDFLRGRGYTHSGVMLTRVVNGDGSREYTLTVHHGKIDKLNDEGRQMLMEDLAGIVFEDENSNFRHEFLIIQ